MTRDISSSASAALISGQNPWQERMAEIAEGAARFLAQDPRRRGRRRPSRSNRRVAAQAAAIINNSPGITWTA